MHFCQEQGVGQCKHARPSDRTSTTPARVARAGSQYGAPAAAGYGAAAADKYTGYSEYTAAADANGGYETYSEYPAGAGAAAARKLYFTR